MHNMCVYITPGTLARKVELRGVAIKQKEDLIAKLKQDLARVNLVSENRARQTTTKSK